MRFYWMLLDMWLPKFDMYPAMKFMFGLQFTMPDVTSFLLDTNYSDFKKKHNIQVWQRKIY